jgi:cbb3-type cytochrome oxidase cytochrome c subunit
MTERWQVGAKYRSKLHNPETGDYNKLMHIHKSPSFTYLTFERYHFTGLLKHIFTARDVELSRYEMIEAAPKDYDPTQQPYEDGDI